MYDRVHITNNRPTQLGEDLRRNGSGSQIAGRTEHHLTHVSSAPRAERTPTPYQGRFWHKADIR